MVLVLTVGSLQYLYTVVGPATAVAGGLLQLVAAIIVGWLLWGAFQGRRPQLAFGGSQIRKTAQ
jgi:hypothetical protein